jgi:membrane fusion protein, multidrug efflux system
LWPGQFVNVRVQLEILRGVIAVPVTAVQYGPDGAYVFVIGPDRVVQKRSIRTGALNKVSAVVEGGLQAGDLVVTDGQYRIEAGSVVEVLADPPPSPG